MEDVCPGVPSGSYRDRCDTHGSGSQLRPVAEISNGRRAQECRRHSQSKCPHSTAAQRQARLLGLWHATNPARCGGGGSQFIECGNEIGGSPLGGNLGRNLPEGLPYQPHAAKLAKERRADDSRDDPHVRCLPDNPPRAWTLPHLTKIMQTPKQLALLYEVNAMYRQIFTDGRPFPEDPTPTWNGYSVGAWEGDALVVRTQGFRDDLWIDTGGSPMSDIAKMTERITRPNYGTLNIELTIDDPKTHEAVHRQLEPAHRARHRARGRVLPREREVVRAHAALARIGIDLHRRGAVFRRNGSSARNRSSRK